jgi:hypothetical protein
MKVCPGNTSDWITPTGSIGLEDGQRRIHFARTHCRYHLPEALQSQDTA